jgi:hypothetical protein
MIRAYIVRLIAGKRSDPAAIAGVGEQLTLAELIATQPKFMQRFIAESHLARIMIVDMRRAMFFATQDHPMAKTAALVADGGDALATWRRNLRD